jgi:hypothetical protein
MNPQFPAPASNSILDHPKFQKYTQISHKTSPKKPEIFTQIRTLTRPSKKTEQKKKSPDRPPTFADSEAELSRGGVVLVNVAKLVV